MSVAAAAAWQASAYHACPARPDSEPRDRDGYGHVSFTDPSTCTIDAISRYFTRLISPPNKTVCPSDHEPFDPNFGTPPQ